ncbi:MAG: transglutaminase-like domain-containing protein, partial [Propionibacteriaceae bacterium]|nr:transglutaminase-like domain-containing protein [Propionibacteriaceae bacterium]
LETDDGRVPVTLGPRWLSGLEGTFYNPVTDSVRLAREPFDEWSYDVVTWRFDRAALAGLAADSEDAPANARRLPALPHGDEIAALAEAVTAGAESDLAKAEALVAYFRGPEFAYAIDTDYGDSEEPLWDFLQDKSGYCVHYATAMAVMARTLGLPTRVAVGFTAGTVVGDQGVREIRGANAHAWPEIHFERAGWVAFEPTPGLTGADEPEPEASAEPTPSAEPTVETTATVDVSATAAPSAGPAPDGPDAEALPLVWPWALAALAAVLVGAGAWGVRCWRRGHATVEQVWGALHAKALRRGWLTPGQSVRAAATALAARLDDPAARQALAELADLVETRRYAPPAAAPANLAAPSDAAAPPDIAMPSDAAAPSDTAVPPNAAASPVLLVPPDAAETPDAAARRHRDRLAAAHLFRRFPGLSRPAPRRSLGR